MTEEELSEAEGTLAAYLKGHADGLHYRERKSLADFIGWEEYDAYLDGYSDGQLDADYMGDEDYYDDYYYYPEMEHWGDTDHYGS